MLALTKYLTGVVATGTLSSQNDGVIVAFQPQKSEEIIDLARCSAITERTKEEEPLYNRENQQEGWVTCNKSRDGLPSSETFNASELNAINIVAISKQSSSFNNFKRSSSSHSKRLSK